MQTVHIADTSRSGKLLMRSLKLVLPPPIEPATFAKAADIWRFEIYRTQGLPPVQRIMCSKPRLTDVNEVLWAILQRLRPFTYNPPFLKDRDIITAIKQGHYADLAQNGLIFVPRWVPVYIARALQSYVVRQLPLDEAFQRHLCLVGSGGLDIRDAIGRMANMLSNQPHGSAVLDRLGSEPVVVFPRDFAVYLGWGFSRCAVEGLTLAQSFGTSEGRKRGGPKWTSFAERVISAEIFYCALRLHQDGKVLTGEYIEDFFVYMRNNDEISLYKDTVIFGWDDNKPPPIISGLDLLGHKAATQAVERTLMRTTGSKARKLLSEYKSWLLDLWIKALKISVEQPRPITVCEADAFHDQMNAMPLLIY